MPAFHLDEFRTIYDEDRLQPATATFQFAQERDSCSSGDEFQVLNVEVTDAGGGNYLTLKTERWALDKEDIGRLANTLLWCLEQCKESS